MLWISCLPTASLFLLLLPCFPGQKGGESEQPTDVISVWKGDSLSITCSVKDSENELGTYLTAVIQQFNVIFVSKHNAYIYPPLVNRTEYSEEGRNLRITLHNVQESDSDIYLCRKYVRNQDFHEKPMGKTTIVVVKAKTSGVVEQSPLYVNPQQGQSVNITCEFKSSVEEIEIYLLKTHTQREKVLYVSNKTDPFTHPAFAGRLNYSKDVKKIVITLHNLQKNDSDIYVCAGVVKNFPFPLVNGNGTMMLIKDAEVEQTDCSNSSWVNYGVIIVVVLLFSAVIYCTFYHINMKKFFRKKKKNTTNTIYEDMSYSSRRNTLVRTYTYSSGN